MKMLMPKSFLKMLEQTMRQRWSKETIRLSKTFHCPRSILFPHVRPECEPEGEFPEGIVELGTAWHKHLQELLGEDWLCEMEVYLKVRNLVIKGHVDAYHPQEHLLIDFKTVAQKSLPFLPKPEHIAQVTSYALAMPSNPKPIPYPPERIWIVYFFREDPSCSNAKIFEFNYPDDLNGYIVDVLEFWGSIGEHLEQKILPDIPAGYDPFKFPCLWSTTYGLTVYCPFWKYCWEQYSKPQIPEDKELLIEKLIDAWNEWKHKQHEVNELERVYKAYLNELTQGVGDEKRIPLTHGFVLEKKRREYVDTTTVKKMLGDKTPIKVTEYWQIEKEG